RRHLLFPGGTSGFALDPREIFLDLGKLVAQHGSFAKEPENALPPAFDGALALPYLILQSVALLIDLEHASARFASLCFEGVEALLMGRDLEIERVQANAHFLRFLLGL